MMACHLRRGEAGLRQNGKIPRRTSKITENSYEDEDQTEDSLKPRERLFNVTK